MEFALALERARQAIGKKATNEDFIAPSAIARLAATLDVANPAPAKGDQIPVGWHAIFGLSAPRRAALSTDGLPAADDLLPPLPLPRRMFGGARLTFHEAVCSGDWVRFESECADISVKKSKSGDIAVATLRHSVYCPRGLAVTEEQDIVHLGPPDPSSPASPSGKSAPTTALWSREIVPDSVLLFRYSALTFNSHRIHYDRPYTTTVEGHPDLLVQGKLLALLLLELVREALPGRKASGFTYRSVRPVYASGAFHVEGQPNADGTSAELWIRDGAGQIAQSATVTFAS